MEVASSVAALCQTGGTLSQPKLAGPLGVLCTHRPVWYYINVLIGDLIEIPWWPGPWVWGGEFWWYGSVSFFNNHWHMELLDSLRPVRTYFAWRSRWRLDPWALKKPWREGGNGRKSANIRKVCVDSPCMSSHCQVYHMLEMEASGGLGEWGEERGSSTSQAWTVGPFLPQTFRPHRGAALTRGVQLSEEY